MITDWACKAESGTCQMTSKYCPTTGSYETGLCAGPANRKCCIPEIDRKYLINIRNLNSLDTCVCCNCVITVED